MFLNNIEFFLKEEISSTATTWATFNVTTDTEQDNNFDISGVSVTFRNKTQIERFECDFAAWVMTIQKRGIDQSSPVVEDVDLQKQWLEWSKWVITSFASDMTDPWADNTFTWDNTFSWDNNFKKITFNDTTEWGLEVNSLTTAQRTALTPVNGTIVYDTDLGLNYQYASGAWGSIDTGTATANMSETVNGTWEIATLAEMAIAESIGGTWARLVVANSNLKKTPDVTPSNDENKVPVLNSDGKVDDFVSESSTTVLGVNSIATDSEVATWTDEIKTVNSKQVWFDVVWGEHILAQSEVGVTYTNTSYEKKKEIEVDVGWIYRIFFNLQNTNASDNSLWRIYVNDIAVWTERTQNATWAWTDFTEDITLVAWDLVQIYGRVTSASTTWTISNFRVKFNTVSKLVTWTVNI